MFNQNDLKQINDKGIDLKTVDFAVGSHAHGDHLNGFDYLLQVNPNVKIYLPFDFYIGAKINFNIEGKEKAIKDSLPEEMQYFGGEENNLNLTINQSGRFWNANVEYVKENTPPRFSNLTMGGGGTLFPSHSLHMDAYNIDRLKDLALRLNYLCIA